MAWLRLLVTLVPNLFRGRPNNGWAGGTPKRAGKRGLNTNRKFGFFVHLSMRSSIKPNNFVFNLLQIIFTLVGLGLIAGGYFATPYAKTDDGYSLKYFLYILGGFFIVWPLLLFGVIKYFIRRAAARQAWLVENGIKGKARVLNMRGTNVYINRVPQMMMDLQVTTELGETYETTYKKTVPMQYYNIIRPDLDLPVYIDPNNRNKLFVDFQQAWVDIAGKSSRP